MANSNFDRCSPAPDPYPPGTTPCLLSESGTKANRGYSGTQRSGHLEKRSSQEPWAETVACQVGGRLARRTQGWEEGIGKVIGKEWTSLFPLLQHTICNLRHIESNSNWFYKDKVRVSLSLCPLSLVPKLGSSQARWREGATKTWKIKSRCVPSPGCKFQESAFTYPHSPVPSVIPSTHQGTDEYNIV